MSGDWISDVCSSDLRSRKSKKGGECVMNNAWCDQRTVHFIESFCSPDLEYLINPVQTAVAAERFQGSLSPPCTSHHRLIQTWHLENCMRLLTGRRLRARRQPPLLLGILTKQTLGKFLQITSSTSYPAHENHARWFTATPPSVRHTKPSPDLCLPFLHYAPAHL